MTFRTRYVLSAMFALGLTTAASAQQWGPSAQSHVYHDTTHPTTLTAYNTTAIAPRQTVQAAPPARQAAVPATHQAAVATRRRVAPAVHRATYHANAQ